MQNLLLFRKSIHLILCAVLLQASVLPSLSWAGSKLARQSQGPVLSGKLTGKARTVAVPAETVMNIALDTPLTSKQSELGAPVTATVKHPVYIGPYLAIPSGSTIYGAVADVNRKAKKDGPNPYVIVIFNRLKRLDDHRMVPINASLIAYKTGLLREDYLWRLPQKRDKFKEGLGSAVEGAAVGFFINPIIGPVIGAGAGVLKSLTLNKVAQGGGVKIKAGEELPIAVQDAFKVPVVDTVSENPKKANI